MNDKQAKRIRRSVVSALAHAGIPFANVYDRLLECHMVPSKRMNVSVPRELSHDFPSLEDWGKPVQVFEGMALLWVNSRQSPRGIYRGVKKRVQAVRTKERPRLLRELRDRITGGVAAALEHARAEAVQREYEAVSRVQGMGVSDSEEGARGD